MLSPDEIKPTVHIDTKDPIRGRVRSQLIHETQHCLRRFLLCVKIGTLERVEVSETHPIVEG